ncbi:MAG: hypothetical protein ABI586_05195 [Candidatus Nanopelagicales bacterium]
MSKTDAQRAMREANFARRQAARPAPPKGAATSGAPTGNAPAAPQKSPARDEPAVAPSAEADAALCGHRSMGNKRCQRPSGHPEKNHRYK